jgi:putative intracellular protease/amidase
MALIETFERAGKPIGFVCHAPGALRHVKKANGEPLVQGRRVTGFTNGEEEGVQLTDVVPFLIEDEFKAQGSLYEKGPDWAPYIVVDGRLVTGQNPASSEGVAKALLALLG